MDEIEALSEYTFESVVRGYHIYQEIWTAQDGKVLQCRKERSNLHDPFAVAMVKKQDNRRTHAQEAVCFEICFLCSESIECHVAGSK